jgi:hypothetical protein
MNHLTSYREKTASCAYCNGEGYVNMPNYEDFIGLLTTIRGSSLPVWDSFKHWRRTGEVICPECLGRGKWIERI